ncbi:MAG: sulfurtransferase FdhD [Betaproteobacteria bacterium TMED100]|nr:MAG: sulfurtransferase FdhD [Betaproteobacteria bacterium TMED100]|tara:strand:+ start:697 stop:1542 length:846 start_codon:yes stop_codon:yes gene_type:complete
MNTHKNNADLYRPSMSKANIDLIAPINVIDEKGREKETFIPAERPLTIYVNKFELVTLMTLGAKPEALVLGYLRNQRIVSKINQVKSIQVDWDTNAAAVVVDNFNSKSILEKVEKKTVTTGCGQGTIFGDIQEDFDSLKLSEFAKLNQSTLISIIDVIRKHESVYKKAGSVHGCALFEKDKMILFVEDVGRHNAVDSIAGMMWLERLRGENLVFYTTGRLTSEMVIKGAQMGIPFLLSRSGVTQMGVQMARKVNLALFGRCSGKHFLLFSGFKRFLLEPPQ